MFNILFVPTTRETEWVQTLLPGISPLEMPVAGMRFFDYAVERGQKLGVQFMEVLDWRFSEEIAEDFAELTSASCPVFYIKGEGEVPHGLNDLEKVSSPLTSPVEDGLTVVWGLVLMSHVPDELKLKPMPDEECARTQPGIYRRKDGKWWRVVPHGIMLRNIVSWLRLNFAVLNNREKFTLPGYTSEPDVHLGRSVVLEHGTKVTAPVLLQDNAWCARNVRLEGDVIIGKGAFIGEGAKLARTVVGDGTYVGAGLDLSDKIVIGNRIFDAIENNWTEVDEPGIAHKIGLSKDGWLHRMWRFLQGSSKGRRG